MKSDDVPFGNAHFLFFLFLSSTSTPARFSASCVVIWFMFMFIAVAFYSRSPKRARRGKLAVLCVGMGRVGVLVLCM